MVVGVPGNVNATLRHDDDDDNLLFPRPPFPVPLPSTSATSTTTPTSTASTTTTSTSTRRRPQATLSATTKVSWLGLVRTLLVVVVAKWGVGVHGYDKLPNGDGNVITPHGGLRKAVSAWIAAGGASSSDVYTTYGPIEEWDVLGVNNIHVRTPAKLLPPSVTVGLVAFLGLCCLFGGVIPGWVLCLFRHRVGLGKHKQSGFPRIHVSLLVSLFAGVGVVQAVPIPDCTYAAYNTPPGTCMLSSCYNVRTCGIRAAVDAYITSGATGSYGPIKDWDTSLVSDMSFVFASKSSFNADISKWQTGKVTTMYYSKCTLLGVVFLSKQE